jgi:hypothetical protein
LAGATLQPNYNGSSVENLSASSLQQYHDLTNLPIWDSQINDYSFEHIKEAIEHFVIESFLPRSYMSLTKASPSIVVGTAQGHRKESLLGLLESFDIDTLEKGAELRICEYPGVESIECCSDCSRSTYVVVKSHVEISFFLLVK